MDLLPVLVAAILTSSLFLYFFTFIRKRAENPKTAPQAAGAWPIIGHLHLLGGSELPHKTLAAMADKFGPVFTLKLGSYPALVVSNWEIAKECFTVRDSVFATRPKILAAELMGYNYAMFGLSPYGPYWREIRKIAMLELLSNRRLELLGHIRRSEVKKSMKGLHDLWLENRRNNDADKLSIEMTEWFGDLSLNIIVRTIAGKIYSGEKNEDHEDAIGFQKSIRDFFKYLGVFVASDAIPWLRWFDIGGYEKAMKKIGKDIDFILQRWLDEHKQKMVSGKVVKKEELDFIDVMLSILEGTTAVQNHSSFDTDTIIKSTCLNILAGGIDTTTLTLTWALSLLLNHPRTLKKAQEELDFHVGKERQVEESDMKNLVYLHAIFKETFRLYPPGPVSALHESVEDCTLSSGYHVPKGTRLIVNTWKIQRDPRVWSDPNEFNPERFLTTHKDIDFRGKHFELLPFGSGRRSCPGISMALQVIQLTLATFIHGFEIKPAGNKQVDMSESFGLTNWKTTPLDVVLSPRLSLSLYE